MYEENRNVENLPFLKKYMFGKMRFGVLYDSNLK